VGSITDRFLYVRQVDNVVGEEHSPAHAGEIATLGVGRRSIASSTVSEALMPDLISIPQAAERLGLHPDTLYRLARTGQFPPAVQIGARRLVSVPRLERFLHGEVS